ncbi:MAG TPA: hypothetical protein VKV28_01290 [Candidatus Binataceae bacterium]|nr:hypothetical protein [Candidatus Binataceae bacterium]
MYSGELAGFEPDRYLMACYNGDKLQARHFPHGQQVQPRDGLVAVIEGHLHLAGDCEWCDRVRHLCWSRRIF